MSQGPGRPKFAPRKPAGGKPFGARALGNKDWRTPRGERRTDEGVDILYGIHSVREALSNPARKFIKFIATENALARLAEDGPIPLEPEIVRPEIINRLLTADAVHQGAYLEAERLPMRDLDALADDSLIIALDQVTDPHNIGAILRSAAAFSVDGLLTTFRYSPEITGVLAKAASGALEHVPIIGVTNLSRALTDLKKNGFLIVGLDSEGVTPIGDVKMQRPLVLVLGAEGKGLRQSTRGHCDILARLDLPGTIKSLNVSNASAISLYATHEALKRAAKA